VKYAFKNKYSLKKKTLSREYNGNVSGKDGFFQPLLNFNLFAVELVVYDIKINV